MNRKAVFLTLILLLAMFTSVSFIKPFGLVAEASSTTIWVPGNYATIQAAINAASANDTIRVRNGSYTENVVVNKSVSIVGDGASITTVTANNTNQPVFNVTANNVQISGFNITGASGTGSAGIYVEGNSSRLTENLIVGNFYGIYLNYSRGNNILYNNVTSNLADGILLDYAPTNYIDRNYNISLNGANGITLTFSTNNTISQNNYITNNTLSAISLFRSTSNTISGNNITKNLWYGIDLFNSSSNVISNNNVIFNGVQNQSLRDYGINVVNSNFVIVSSNNVSVNLGHGIYLDNSHNCTVSDNIVLKNGFHGIFLNNLANTTATRNKVYGNTVFGIWLDNDRFCEVSSNNVTNHPGDGIRLDNTINTQIFDNTVVSNGVGIAIRTPICVLNTIYNNYCNNTINAVENAGPNSWNITKQAGQNIIGGSWLGGNFWSDYAGGDLPPYDGIGDTQLPYNCSGRIKNSTGDWLPLTTKTIPTYNLTVKVTTTLGQAISGANVTVDSRSKLTNATGYAVFTNLPSGGYNVNASRTGFFTWGLWLNLTRNTNITLQMRAMPVATFQIWPYFPKPGDFVLFNASDSYDPDGIIIDYLWDFGDETYDFGEVVGHVYDLPGYYNVTLTVIDNDGLTDTTWNIVAVDVPVHDVAVIDVTPFKTILGEGYPLYINVTVENQGNFTETFNVTAYANNTAIQTLNVPNLPPGNSIIITFMWNTTGFAKGNYTMSAKATIVTNETYTDNNSFTDGTIRINMVGDIAPEYGIINIVDIVKAAIVFWSERGDPDYNPNADINDDGVINIIDIVLIAIHFGETDP